MFLQNTYQKAFASNYQKFWICLLLMIVLWVVYGQVRHFEYIDFDDSLYVAGNRYVQKGLTLKSIGWAFKFKDSKYLTYWHPLTWLSHMLDSQLFGLNPGWHHLSNLFFHILNSVLLFLILNRISGALWRSAFVAALFAVHPLNIESVAWVSERKNVLSTFFWMLTLMSYTHYTVRPVYSRYLLTILFFMLGLMAKPMLITLPAVMLLLDYWPLQRLELNLIKQDLSNDTNQIFQTGIQRERVKRLVMEKIPFFVISLVSVYLSSSAVQTFKTVVSTELVPMKLRIANALVTYFKYILKMLWPQGLTIFYPYPKVVPAWQVAGALLFLVGVTLTAVRLTKSRPYFLTGWLWYIGSLVPVMGLMQAGLWPEMADRWAYIPQVGIFIIMVWGVTDVLQRGPYKKVGLVILSISIMVVLMTITRIQLKYWQNSLLLFEQAVRVDKNNLKARMMLGAAWEKRGMIKEALRCYNEIVLFDPAYSDAYNNIGIILAKQGKTKEALKHFRQVLHYNPVNPLGYFNLGNVLSDQENYLEAIAHYSKAIRLKPEFLEAYNNMGMALAKLKRFNEAIGIFVEALKIDPNDEKILGNLRVLQSVQEKNDVLLMKRLKEHKGNLRNHKLHYEIGNIYK